MRILKYLFVLLSFCANAQGTFHSLISQPSYQPGEISIEGFSTVLGKATYAAGDRAAAEIYMQNASLWIDGKSILSYPFIWNGGFSGYGALTYYDERNSYYPTHVGITRKGSSPDRHPYPVIGRNDDGTILVLQEQAHVGDMMVYHGEGDFSKFVEKPTQTNLCARITMYKISTGWAVVYQYNQDDIVVQTCDPDGTNWSSTLTIGDFTSSSRGYPAAPFGNQVDDNGWYYLTITPFYTSGFGVKVKFLVKTQDFVTFSNYQETHSFTAGSPLTDAQFQTNGYAYIGVYNAEVTYYGTLSGGITPDGEFFGISSDSTYPSDGLITSYWNGSSWTQNTYTLPSDMTSPNAVDQTIPMWMLCRSANDIYLCLSIGGKPHLLWTGNLGVSWTDFGDMLPDRAGYYRMVAPQNALEIPTNRNFAFFFCEDVFDNVTPVQADIYAVRASFGQLQTETPQPFTTTGSSLTEITGADFVYGTDDYDGTVTGFYDKTGGGRTGTKVGTPTVVANEMVFNGTDQSIAVSTPGDLSDDQFTFACVARHNSGGNAYILAHAVSSSTTAFCYVALTTTGLTVFWRSPSGTSNTVTVTTTFTSTVHNVIVVTGDHSHYRIYINGIEQVQTYVIGAGIGDLALLGNWSSDVASMNSVRIGGIGRSGPVFSSPAITTEIAYWPRVLSTAERKKAENILSDLSGVAITNNQE